MCDTLKYDIIIYYSIYYYEITHIHNNSKNKINQFHIYYHNTYHILHFDSFLQPRQLDHNAV